MLSSNWNRARPFLSTTDPLYLRRLAAAVRHAIWRGSAYYCGTRIWRVRFHHNRIEYQALGGSVNARPRWQWASKPEGFTDGSRGGDICASREQPRRGARCR